MHIKCMTTHFVFKTPHIPASRNMDNGIKTGIAFSFYRRKYSINLYLVKEKSRLMKQCC